MADPFSNYCFNEDFHFRQNVYEIGSEIGVKVYDSIPNAKGKKNDAKSFKVKKEQAAITIKWLKKNYCACPEVCLPREIIYGHYLEFCKKTSILPACKATFGKLIRNTFPSVTSKRLGARGQSKYHYNGIGIQQSSEYFKAVQPTGVTRFSSSSLKSTNPTKKFTLATKIGTLLPSFPDFDDLIIPHSENKEKMKIFLTMYRIHCQCIVDTIIGGNFEETRLFLLHFWQGFPDHLISIFNDDLSLNIVATCDSIFYRTLIDVLIPTEVMEMPEKLLCGIQNMSSHWEKWLESSLENMPPKLQELKMVQGRRFCKALKRNSAFLHLAQVTRPVLNETSMQLLAKELTYLHSEERVNTPIVWTKDFFLNSCAEFDIFDVLEILPKKELCVEALIDISDGIIREIESKDGKDMDIKARHSLLKCVYTLSKISLWLTENKSDNFITFHLISSLIQEYLLLAFETLKDRWEEHLIHSKLWTHLKSSDLKLETRFKSPTSCFLVTEEKHRHGLKRAKQIESKNSPAAKKNAFVNVHRSQTKLLYREPCHPHPDEYNLKNESLQMNRRIYSQEFPNGVRNHYISEFNQRNNHFQIQMPPTSENGYSQGISHPDPHHTNGIVLPTGNYSDNTLNYSLYQSNTQSSQSQCRGNIWEYDGYLTRY